MIYLLSTIHVLVCIFLILVVLLQQGKGADLSVFGGGSTQTAFGARSAATVLHKLTVFCFVAFILTTIGIAFVQKGGSASVVGDEAPAPVAEEIDPVDFDGGTDGEAVSVDPIAAPADGAEASDEATPSLSAVDESGTEQSAADGPEDPSNNQ
ncbi:MAG: preprotein translocase subunit SecG [Acidobacteriota bacterium]